MLTRLARRSILLVRPTSISAYIENGIRTNQLRAFSSQPLLLSNLQVGDRVLLRWKAGRQFKTKLTTPLREDSETFVDSHVIHHKDLLDKPSNSRVTNISKDGLKKLQITARHPTLDEFTSLSPRRVAPIYATYASTIVSLLDIHAEPPEPPNSEDLDNPTTPTEPTLQILEAGTGHGSLTLHLSRAIAPSNPPIPQSIKPIPSRTRIYRAGDEASDDIIPSRLESPALQQWRSTRRAILHTIDIDQHNRAHADQMIRSYRNAVYWPHIDFHVADVKDWIAERLHRTSDPKSTIPFLDIALLDMPGVESYISHTIPALKDDGLLLVFAPQITQIATCVQEIVTRGLGVKLERVVELGDGISTGRDWDVRMATLKNVSGKLSRRVRTKGDGSDGGDMPVERDGVEAGTNADSLVSTIPPMVCRPIVGEATRGGGFIGLWKKIGAGENGTTSS